MNRPHLLAAALAAGLLLLSACAAPPAPPEAARAVRTLVVAGGDEAAVASYSGEIRARRELTLGFQVSGRIQQRLVEVGAEVTVGTPLFRLDPQDSALNARAARSSRDSARSQLRQAQLDLERYERLATRAYVSRIDLEKARLAVQTAQESLTAAEANARLADNQAAYTTLTATADGVVTALEAEVGQVVQPGQVVVRIAERGERELVVSVPEQRVDELRGARSLAIELWAQPERVFAGRLRELAPDTDDVTRTYEARISVLDADLSVRLGMTGRLRVQLPADTGLRRLPLTAILDRAGQPTVWIVDAAASAVHARPVTLAGTRADGVLVASGLDDGDVVVTAGVNLLHEGQAVRLLAAETAGPAAINGAPALAAAAAEH